jgi:hypothetical protein
VAQLEEIAPLDVVYTDFTELRFAGGTQKAYLMPVFDNRKCQQRIIENVSIMTSNTTNRSSKMSAVGH